MEGRREGRGGGKEAAGTLEVTAAVEKVTGFLRRWCKQAGI
jgi:hypothetical protein